MISRLHNLLKKKKISCVELAQKYISATEKLNKKLNAYVLETPEVALQAAKVVDEKIARGEEIGLLEGIPASLKDNISTSGLQTSCCSKILQGYIPIYDAFVWKILKNCNVALIGKANMDEFAMGSSCETSFYGGAKNPVNVDYVSGGSSGGAASAVGGGLCVFSLGSDTGGSVRQPASFCGLVGLKPTYGAVSRFGLIAFASSLDQIGVLATSSEDVAAVFDEISVCDENDSTCQGSFKKTFTELEKSFDGVKIGFCEQFFNMANDEVKASVRSAIGVYEKMGAKIVDVSLPSTDYALAAYYIIACAEASSNLGRYDGIRYGFRTTKPYHGVHDMICKTRSEGFGSEVKRRILLGTYVLSSGYYDAYYKKAQAIRSKIIHEFDEAFKGCSLIATPTSPTTAFKSQTKFENATESYYADCCTVPINIAGLPAVSLPCGFDKTGLPIGLQLIGPRFSEGLLLAAANSFEKQTENCFSTKIKEGVSF